MITSLFILVLVLGGNSTASTNPRTETYQDTRRLLSAMQDPRIDSDKLAALFKVGDRRAEDLIQALDDSDRNISVHAQIVIRYLGNAEGMKALNDWYGRQGDEYPLAGPIPLPLDERDYRFIKVNLLGRPPKTWGGREQQYIYSLALDGSPQAAGLLDKLIKQAGEVEKINPAEYAIERIQTSQPSKPLPAQKDLARLVLDNAFFVSLADQKHASARVLALNDGKDKALVEVYINRGRLAEEWYHVVIRKCDKGWKFFSITPVAVS